MTAVIARVGCRALFTVEGFGKYARRRSLADATDSGKKIRMGNPISPDRIAQRPGDMLLPGDIVETLRPPLAG
jgi:hypothetical protein